MDFIEKCKVAGIGNGACFEGYPVHNDRVFKKIAGTLKAFIRRNDPKPWENPLIEDTAFDSNIIAKIQTIQDGKLEELDQTEQNAIAAAELKELEETTAPSNAELLKRIEALEALINP